MKAKTMTRDSGLTQPSAIDEIESLPFKHRKLGSTKYETRQTGFSLLELLIAMTLGFFVILGATQMFMQLKDTSYSLEANSRLLESGRMASELLHKRVRMARYFGCGGLDDFDIINHYDSATSSTANGSDQQGLFGVDGASGAPDEIIVYQAIDNTSITITALADLGEDDDLIFSAGHGLAANDWISLTDCGQADVFPLSSVSTNTAEYANCGTCTNTYVADSSVLEVSRLRFYIANGASGEPTLFQQDLTANDTQEVMEGVEDMQITYGYDISNDGIANQFLTATQVNALCAANGNTFCWREVATVRIALLIRSTTLNSTQNNQTYTYNGSTVTATDNRLRREFLSIISLRNYRI